MTRAAFAIAAMLSAIALPARAQGCRMEPDDSAWLAGALEQWRIAERRDLGLPAAPLPAVVAADGACTYVLPEGRVAAPKDGRPARP